MIGPTFVKVGVKHADGVWQEWEDDPEILARLRAYEAQGLRGKALIHELLTNQWSDPPTLVMVSGVGPNGEPFEIRVPYD